MADAATNYDLLEPPGATLRFVAAVDAVLCAVADEFERPRPEPLPRTRKERDWLAAGHPDPSTDLLLVDSSSRSESTGASGPDPAEATYPVSEQFRVHFSDPLYLDLEGEFAPFGTDEGFDLLHQWSQRRLELGRESTVTGLLHDSGFGDVIDHLDAPDRPGVPWPEGPVDAATIVIGAGFTLLRLTGHIDEQGRQLTLHALELLVDFHGPQPELRRQQEDLRTWKN